MRRICRHARRFFRLLLGCNYSSNCFINASYKLQLICLFLKRLIGTKCCASTSALLFVVEFVSSCNFSVVLAVNRDAKFHSFFQCHC